MLNALVTLPFLLALAIAGMAIVESLTANGAKIMAALKGRSLLAEPPLATRPVKVSYTPRPAQVRVPVKPAAQWRAAA